MAACKDKHVTDKAAKAREVSDMAETDKAEMDRVVMAREGTVMVHA